MSDEPARRAKRAGPRRATSGPPLQDEATPGGSTPGAVTPGGATQRADPEGARPVRAAEDEPHAWGDDDEGGDANDERLLRDRPPHW